MLNRYSRHQRIVDVFVTNVSGPQRPLYVLGARLVEAFPVVQVAGNVPLSVAVLSYAGQLNIGIQSDPDGLPDLDVFVDGLRRSLEELGAATPSRPGWSRADRPTLEQLLDQPAGMLFTGASVVAAINSGAGSAWPCWPTRSRAWRRGRAGGRDRRRRGPVRAAPALSAWGPWVARHGSRGTLVAERQY